MTIQSGLDKNRRRITIQSIQDLPTLSTIITKLVAMLESENSSPKDLSDLISKDQSILTAILKLVNSAFYGFPRKITSVHQAVVILGFNTVKSMALGASIFKARVHTGGKEYFDRDALWVHSVGVGTAAKIMAGKVGYKDVEEAFVAGLVHDIGKVIFDAFFPEDFRLVTERVKKEGGLIQEAEREILGIDHAEAGQLLLFKWQIPLAVVNAVGFHHDLEKVPRNYRDLASIVHLSDIVCRKLKIGSGGDGRTPRANRNAARYLKLSTETLEDVLHETEENRKVIDRFSIQ